MILHGRRGTYRVVERLHEGRAGTVCRAVRECDGVDVAVKLFQLDRPSDVRELEQELHALRTLGERATLPTLLDWQLDRTGASPGFAVLEFFARGSLADLILDHGALDDAQLRRLFDDLLDALEAMHSHRGSLLHLDIKPANVLVGAEGYVLADLGLSRPVGVRAGILPPTYGTRGYRAPEQARARPELFGVRTDLYGLGATMWCACTGRLLVEGDETHPALYGLLPLSALAPEVDEALSRAIMELLRSRPGLRPANVYEVRRRLSRAPELDATLRAHVFEGEHARREALTDLTNPLLRHVLTTMGSNLRVARFERGDTLCTVGDPSYHAFLLIRGLLAVERGGQTLALFDAPGEIVGEIAALTGLNRTASLTAREETLVVVFDGGELLDFLRLNPELAIQHVAALAERVAREVALT